MWLYFGDKYPKKRVIAKVYKDFKEKKIVLEDLHKTCP